MENLALPLLQRKVGQDHRTAIEGRGVCRLLLAELLDLLLLRLRDFKRDGDVAVPLVRPLLVEDGLALENGRAPRDTLPTPTSIQHAQEAKCGEPMEYHSLSPYRSGKAISTWLYGGSTAATSRLIQWSLSTGL